MKKTPLWLFVLTFIIIFTGSFLLGRYPVSLTELLKIAVSPFLLMEKTWSPGMETIVLNVRMPRVISAAVVGAGLSCAGVAWQGALQNPLASPDRLGASSGAAFGAVLGLLMGAGRATVTILSFISGMLAVGLVYLICIRMRRISVLGLLLAGVVVQALFSEGVSFIKLVADPLDTLPSITYWMMGSLASVRPWDAVFLIVMVSAGLLPIFLMSWQLNVLSMGDETARSLGVSPVRLQFMITACAALVTAACVSVCGVISWVGLAVPHLCRLMVGADHRRLLGASALFGASFLLFVDNIARLAAASEIPIGILTSFCGAPLFLYLIIREGKR